MTLDGITLPDSLFWDDEYDWQDVAQSQERSVTGAFLVQEAARTYGRPVTLSGGRDACWVTRATLDLLKAKANTADLNMPVTLPDGQALTVRFNRDDGSPIKAERVTRFGGPPTASTLYALIELRLITVTP